MKTLVIGTGGTIATRRDPASGELGGRCDAEEICARLPAPLSSELECINYRNVASMEIGPSDVLAIVQLLREKIADDGVDAAIIMHGTDTLEESAYLCDILWDLSEPVVFTGAMRGGGLLGEDGIRNLQASLAVVQCEESVGRGVQVVLNDEIHRAWDATKGHSLNPAAFISPRSGIAGEVWLDDVVYYGPAHARHTIETDVLDTRVDLIRTVTGMGVHHVEASMQAGASGIVIEGAGTGAVPGDILAGLQAAVKQGLAVTVTTRCLQGPAPFWPESRDRMSQLFSGGLLSGPKARLRLMAALGKYPDMEDVRTAFERGGKYGC